MFTLGVRADPTHVLCDPAEVGAELISVDRGGDVTYHGPGQLVGYPILTRTGRRLGRPAGGMADTVAYVTSVEQLIIDVLDDLGLSGAGRLRGHPGVWIDPAGPAPRKIAAVGVRISRGRTMHGFALNVAPDLAWFDRIVPCGIAELAVTSLAAEGIDVPMGEVVEAVARRAADAWGAGEVERQDVAPPRGSPARGGQPGRGPGGDPPAQALLVAGAGPAWDPAYIELKRTMRDLDLVTVCEEAGCPNIFDCWADGTATFMLNGDRCTRACGFCLVDTRRPLETDPAEPDRVAEAVRRMGLQFAVLTAVAPTTGPTGRGRVRGHHRGHPAPQSGGGGRGADPGLQGRSRRPGRHLRGPTRRVEPQHRDGAAPAADGAAVGLLRTRSLAVLARARAAGLSTKSGIMVGLGETADEVVATLADLRGVGVSSVTIGQYLRPTADHLAVARWWTPDELADLAERGRALGFAHVEASPLTRSSYHAPSGPGAGAAGSPALGVRANSWPGRRGRLPVSDHVKTYARLDDELVEWIGRQHVFFVATARRSTTAMSTCRPRATTRSGCSILDRGLPRPHRERGRDDRPRARERSHHPDVLRLEGPPKIVRLQGRGQVVVPGDAGSTSWRGRSTRWGNPLRHPGRVGPGVGLVGTRCRSSITGRSGPTLTRVGRQQRAPTSSTSTAAPERPEHRGPG